METVLDQTHPALSDIFITWLLVGIQSFGGGSSTFYLTHQAAIKRGWLSEDEFVRAWALAQIAPGINLVKLTVLIGYRLHGGLGLVAAMAGLLLPSAAVTVLMTAGFATIRSLSMVQAMMKGIMPAAIGLSLSTGVQMAQPLFVRAHQEGVVRLGAHFLILSSAALLLALLRVSPIVVLLLSGAVTVPLLALIPISDSARFAKPSAR